MTRPGPVLSRLAATGLSVGLVAVLVVATAAALDDVNPAPGCHGVLAEDPKADGADAQGLGRTSDALEIERTFFKFDPAKGAEASTLNVQVKNLSKTVPAGATGLQWDFKWEGGDGTTRFVRAVVDFTGGTVFEYGSVDESPTLPRYVAEGDTPGKFFEGPHGVVQLVVPAASEKPGATLKGVTGGTAMNFQVVPSAVRTPTRGIFSYYDNTATKAVTLATCAPDQAAGVGGVGTVTRALPVRVRTKSARARKLRHAKTLSFKLQSTEVLTNLAGQLRKGKSATYGKGSLKELSGAGTLKLKLSRRLSKASYTLDLVGNDDAGNRLATRAKFKVK